MKRLLMTLSLLLALTSQASAACTFFIDNSSTGCGGSGCSDSNAGTSLATAWLTLGKLASTTLSGGQTACLVGQANPNKTNGGIWRETYTQAGGGTAWGSSTQVTITSADITKPAIITGSDCLGAANGYCTGASATTWHHCTSGDATCESSADPNITNVYEFTTSTAVKGAIYVDDPDVINGTTLWPTDSSHPSSTFLVWAHCLPGGGCSAVTGTDSTYEGPMTAGSFWWNSANNHLYIWTANASDPGTHTIEAVTRQQASGPSSDGIIRLPVAANGFTQYSYLKLIYFMVSGFEIANGGDNRSIPFKADHIQGGGAGAGPVTNNGAFYGAVIMAAYGGSQPTGALSSSDVTITNGVYNWCGRNCLNVQGTNGAIVEQNNKIGVHEHSGFDIKCAFNVLIQNDLVHDDWPNAVIGSDNSATRNAYYTEMDWNSCAGGTITWQNDTAFNVNMGFFCNVGSAVNSGGKNLTCLDYNTTVVLGSSYPVAGNCFYTQVLSGTTITRDTRNNICYMKNSSDIGFLWSTGGTSTVTEADNLYFNTGGTNTNSFGGSSSTTLANWQSNCGGGGACGTADIWQVNPLFSDLAGYVYRLFNYSPAINAGTTAVGTNKTMGGTSELVGGGE
ncbi:MAG: hypothetical protein KGJ90_01965 [Patescibacteria group bacterium]|nr:hypothetical protein [Patescibacteria group bacterium]